MLKIFDTIHFKHLFSIFILVKLRIKNILPDFCLKMLNFSNSHLQQIFNDPSQ